MKFKATNPDDIEMTLTVTMSLRDWKKLKKQLTGEYPSLKLVSEISSMIYQAEKHFVPEDNKNKYRERNMLWIAQISIFPLL